MEGFVANAANVDIIMLASVPLAIRCCQSGTMSQDPTPGLDQAHDRFPNALPYCHMFKKKNGKQHKKIVSLGSKKRVGHLLVKRARTEEAPRAVRWA